MSKDKSGSFLIVLILLIVLLFISQTGSVGIYFYIDDVEQIVEVKDVNAYLPPFSVVGTPIKEKYYAVIVDMVGGAEPQILKLKEIGENIYFLDYDPTDKMLIISICEDPNCEKLVGSVEMGDG